MTDKKKPLLGKKKAILAARCLEEKKALDIVLLEVLKITPIADYFVIATGESKRQIKACSEHIEETLSMKGEYPHHLEGDVHLEWVLMDYGDVVIHIFDKEARVYYGLERLWGDAPQVTYRVRRKKVAGGSEQVAGERLEVRSKK